MKAPTTVDFRGHSKACEWHVIPGESADWFCAADCPTEQTTNRLDDVISGLLHLWNEQDVQVDDSHIREMAEAAAAVMADVATGYQNREAALVAERDALREERDRAQVLAEMNANLSAGHCRHMHALRAALERLQPTWCELYCRPRPTGGEDWVHEDDCDQARAALAGETEGG